MKDFVVEVKGTTKKADDVKPNSYLQLALSFTPSKWRSYLSVLIQGIIHLCSLSSCFSFCFLLLVSSRVWYDMNDRNEAPTVHHNMFFSNFCSFYLWNKHILITFCYIGTTNNIKATIKFESNIQQCDCRLFERKTSWCRLCIRI